MALVTRQQLFNMQFSKLLVFINAIVPLALMLWDIYRDRVGANPLEYATRTTGMLTLVFLTLTIAVSPVRQVFKWNGLGKFRRMLGLFAFFYGFLHLLTYVAFDRYFNLRTVPSDVAARPFIAIGMLAFFLMVPLAITSTNKMVKRLGGKRWRILHRLVYAAGVAGVLHFWLLVKSDTRLPVTFGFVMLLLLAHRIFAKLNPPGTTSTHGSLIPRD
ncbi:MAG TPA: protein-methionine-sulfoxide reductase heme-binding subunit MsrQ [Pyrinomonadaceae bacterium]|nr:protein-methionine-sulfoxide reductase heme-binding subunit MsrQ [Pyrinomonadaceae bacterium]